MVNGYSTQRNLNKIQTYCLEPESDLKPLHFQQYDYEFDDDFVVQGKNVEKLFT